MAVGVFATDTLSGNGGVAGDTLAHAGWVVTRQGTGPVTSLTVANDGASYANLAVGIISNGAVNSTFYVVVNSTGHVQSATLIDSGGLGFINVASVHIGSAANGIVTFHIGGGSGYANGEIVTVSNGVVNATASITTNTTGGISSLTFVAPGYAGSGFANNTAPGIAITTVSGTNGNVTVNSLAGGAGLVLTPTLGGRAGRITSETLVASKYITCTTNSVLFTV